MNADPSAPGGSRNPPRRSLNHSEVADARTALVKKIMDDEKKIVDAKTARLRAERLAKEEGDRARAQAEAVPPSVRGRRTGAKHGN